MDITQYPVVTRVTTLSLLLGTLSGCDLFNKDDETEAPEASFSVNETSGTAPVTVTFTDTSEDGSDDIYQWLWEFGDGNTSSLQNPQHDYPIPGTYTVSLTVTSEDGADTETRTDLISVEALPPVAAFSVSTSAGDAPLTVTFSDDSSQGTGTINQWTWDFGDGNTSIESSPEHIYTEPGEYTVSLTVSDEYSSHSVTATEPVVVLAVPPEAAMEVSATSGDMPFTVTFTDTSSAGSGEITQWLWDFGDGTTSDEANPSHTYTEPGSYTVSLAVTADGTDTVTQDSWIEVNDPYVTVTLNVQTTDRELIEGLTVSSETFEFDSISQNEFDQLLIRMLPVENSGVIRIQKTGFVDALVYLDSVAVDSSRDVTMNPRGNPFIFSGATGGEFSTNEGAKLTVAPYSLADSQGNIVTTDIELYITTVDVNDSVKRNAFPGAFLGVREDYPDENTKIASYGSAEMTFYAGDEELQLVDGATAELEIPLFVNKHIDGSPVIGGDMIPFWILNETSGIWEQQGWGEVVLSDRSPTGFAHRATTNHFTWFNTDAWSPLNPSAGRCRIEVIINGATQNEKLEVTLSRITPFMPVSNLSQSVIYDGVSVNANVWEGSRYRFTFTNSDNDFAELFASCEGQDLITDVDLPGDGSPIYTDWGITVIPVFEWLSGQSIVTRNRIVFGGRFENDADNTVEVYGAFIPNGGIWLPNGAKQAVEVEGENGSVFSLYALLENEVSENRLDRDIYYVSEHEPVISAFNVNGSDLDYTIQWEESGTDNISCIYQGLSQSIAFSPALGTDHYNIDFESYGFTAVDGNLMCRFSNQYGDNDIYYTFYSACATDLCLPQ